MQSSGIISDKQEVNSLDFQYLFSLLFPNKKFEARYYGVAKIKRQEKYGEEIMSKTIKFADNLRKIKNCLASNGIKYCATGSLKVRDRDECKKCGAKDYKMQEKGVDVGLAIDIVKDVLQGNVNHVVIIGSDTDLIPAIKIVKENHIPISYVAFSGKETRALSRLANETLYLNNVDIARAYAQSL